MRLVVAAIVGLSLGCAAVFAGQPCPVKAEKKQTCMPNLKNQVPLYETFDNDGVNLGARGDVLYMIYQVPVLTYASEQQAVGGVLESHILNVPGKMSLGCDVALLYTMGSQPGYSFEAGWYHIVAKFSRNVDSEHLLPAHSVSLLTARPGNALVNAQMTLNFFDLLVKKDFAFGDWVSVSPTAGLVGGYMNSESTAHFRSTLGNYGTEAAPNTSTAATLPYTSKFEGIGLKLGGCSSFRIWKGFKLKAELFYNVLYGYAKAKLNYSQNGVFATLTGTNVRFSQHQARAFFDSLLGLAWETRFNCDSIFLDFHAGWRFQTFIDGWKEFQAEFNDALLEHSFAGQGLQAGVTFKF